jgi:methionine biosynthesis protein MetW
MSHTTREGAPLASTPTRKAAAVEQHRPDHLLIADMVTPGARVLDVGSGDGQLLRLLIEKKNVDGRGIELSRAGVNAAVAHGLSVIEGDADTDLADYPDDSFDFVILSQTLQATRQPKQVMEHLLRIGRQAVVSVPNFGHWRMRAQLVLFGRMPVTPTLPLSWYDTPNIHLCTIRDFVDLCDETGARMDRAVALDSHGRPVRVNAPWWFWNLFGAQAVFLLSRR